MKSRLKHGDRAPRGCSCRPLASGGLGCSMHITRASSSWTLGVNIFNRPNNGDNRLSVFPHYIGASALLADLTLLIGAAINSTAPLHTFGLAQTVLVHEMQSAAAHSATAPVSGGVRESAAWRLTPIPIRRLPPAWQPALMAYEHEIEPARFPGRVSIRRTPTC